MTTKKLPASFIGKGEVKGFEFNRIMEGKDYYLYSVIINEQHEHFEVIKKKSAKVCIDFEKRKYSDTESKEYYPKARAFGEDGFSFKDKNKAVAFFEELEPF